MGSRNSIQSNLEVYVPHLHEFRTRFIYCLASVALLMIVFWEPSQEIINWLWKHSAPQIADKMIYLTPLEPFFVRLKLTFIISIVCSCPIWTWHIVKYISPALYVNEKKAFITIILLSFCLFFLGGLLALFFTYPLLINFSYQMQSDSIMPFLNMGSCVSLACWLIIGFGLCFQLPLVILVLLYLKILSLPQLKRVHKFIILGIFIASAIFTPPDAISLLCMALPTWIFFEITLLMAKYIIPRNDYKKQIRKG